MMNNDCEYGMNKVWWNNQNDELLKCKMERSKVTTTVATTTTKNC